MGIECDISHVIQGCRKACSALYRSLGLYLQSRWMKSYYRLENSGPNLNGARLRSFSWKFDMGSLL